MARRGAGAALGPKWLRVMGLLGVLVLVLVAGAWTAGQVQALIAVRTDARDARRLIAEGKFAEARGPLERWLKARPDSGEAVFLLARGALHFQLFDQGLQFLARAETLGYPGGPIARERGRALLRIGRYDEAAAILNRLVFAPGAPPDPQADEALAQCYLETFQLGAATSVITRWIRDAPRDPKPYLWKAQVDRRTEADPAVLTEDYQNALKRDPGCAEALLNLGEMDLAAHRLQDAEARYSAYLARFPDDSAAHLGLGKTLAELGDDQAAAGHLDRAAALAPRDPGPLRERARIDLRGGKLAAALAGLDRALALDAEDLEVHYLRGLVLARLGRKEEARSEQEAAARLRRDRDELAALLAALNAAPRDLTHQYNAARWLFAHGHPEEALRWTEKILRVQPSHPETNHLVADYYEKQGEPGRARFYRLQAGPSPSPDAGRP
jgi:tetratricopeptide (TPR) repeat protein